MHGQKNIKLSLSMFIISDAYLTFTSNSVFEQKVFAKQYLLFPYLVDHVANKNIKLYNPQLRGSESVYVSEL